MGREVSVKPAETSADRSFGRLRGSIIRVFVALQVRACDTKHTPTSGKHAREKQTDSQARHLKQQRDIRPSLSVILANCSPSNQSLEQNKYAHFMLFWFFSPFFFFFPFSNYASLRASLSLSNFRCPRKTPAKHGKHSASEF